MLLRLRLVFTHAIAEQRYIIHELGPRFSFDWVLSGALLLGLEFRLASRLEAAAARHGADATELRDARYRPRAGRGDRFNRTRLR